MLAACCLIYKTECITQYGNDLRAWVRRYHKRFARNFLSNADISDEANKSTSKQKMMSKFLEDILSFLFFGGERKGQTATCNRQTLQTSNGSMIYPVPFTRMARFTATQRGA